MKKIKIYISGKITGKEEQARVLFNKTQEAIESIKTEKYQIEALNPFNFDVKKENPKWEDYMKACIKELVDADYILMIENDWNNSRGAKMETQIAQSLNIPFILKPEETSYEDLIKFIKKFICLD